MVELGAQEGRLSRRSAASSEALELGLSALGFSPSPGAEADEVEAVDSQAAVPGRASINPGRGRPRPWPRRSRSVEYHLVEPNLEVGSLCRLPTCSGSPPELALKSHLGHLR